MNNAIRLLLTLFLFAAASCFSQNRLLIGVQGGANSTMIKQTNFTTKRYTILGGSCGLSLDYKMPSVGIGADFLLKQTAIGSNQLFDTNLVMNAGESVFTKVSSTYFSIPLKLHLSPQYRGLANSRWFGISLGVIPSWLRKTNASTTIFDVEGHEKLNTQTPSELKPADFYLSVFVGFNLQYHLRSTSKWYILLSGYYAHGLKSITTNDFFPESEIKLREVNLSIGIQYNLFN